MTGTASLAYADAAPLAAIIARLNAADGLYTTAIAGLKLFRCSTPTEPTHCLYEPSLAVIAQGAKRVELADEVYEYRAGQALLTSLDLPVISHISQASAERPYLGLALTLDSRTIMQLAVEADLPPVREAAPRGLRVGGVSDALMDALVRLVRLLDEPAAVPLLAPLIQKEILLRLLIGPDGARLRQLAATGSRGHQVARAVAWLKQNFAQTLRIDELASRLHMSPSSFRLHFRAVTGMAPLQYQKQLRLQEARWLMLNSHLDAATAAMRVGYESPSQFSREYSRVFGAPPARDIARLRKQTFATQSAAESATHAA
ncbi:MAG: AraC family transcriptional regulator [Rhodanobacter denitrificans]|uniref:AraC family transcriptional regulator n=1 Tax=Rhodanobacter denitrificans TaxID=666685 RepID=A0A2W5MG34_9GAMM|nr:MAG: AraC family transcriptional regulator [Rhodanobacter denitrificans]